MRLTAHGPTMGLIRDFTDFHLLRLRPTGGVMVLDLPRPTVLKARRFGLGAHSRAS